MARILESSIDRLLTEVSIEDVIGGYTELRKRGGSFSGCCPFHEEKSPSFYVSAQKGLYNCFSCGNGGDLIKFIQEAHKMNYPQALEKLAEIANFSLQYEVEENKSPDKIMPILRNAMNDINSPYEPKTISQFNIGYCKSLKQLPIEAPKGIIEGSYVIPIVSTRTGEVVGYDGLYGFNNNKMIIVEKKELHLFTDNHSMLMAYESGIENVASMQGTFTVKRFIKMFKRMNLTIIAKDLSFSDRMVLAQNQIKGGHLEIVINSMSGDRLDNFLMSISPFHREYYSTNKSLFKDMDLSKVDKKDLNLVAKALFQRGRKEDRRLIQKIKRGV